MQNHIHLNSAGSACRRIEDSGIAEKVDDRSGQDGFRLVRIGDDPIPRARYEFPGDGCRDVFRQLVLCGGIPESRNGDRVDALRNQVGLSGHVVAAGREGENTKGEAGE